MKKALILAADLVQFRNFCRTFSLNPRDYVYVVAYEHVCGWWIDKPVVLLEGYEYNRNYTVELMNYIGRRFENIGFLSEGEIYSRA